MKKCFTFSSFKVRSDYSFQVGTLLEKFNTGSSVDLLSYVYRNCCEYVAKTSRGLVVELVDTLGLGPSIARCEGSSPFQPTKKTRISFVFLQDNLLKCVDAMFGWEQLDESRNSKIGFRFSLSFPA